MRYIDYLLVKLMEEASELQKPSSKAILFGLNSVNPFEEHPLKNIDEIYAEFTDVYATMEELHEELKGTEFRVSLSDRLAKRLKLRKYYKIHQELKSEE